jgi:hypothetical protein
MEKIVKAELRVVDYQPDDQYGPRYQFGAVWKGVSKPMRLYCKAERVVGRPEVGDVVGLLVEQADKWSDKPGEADWQYNWKLKEFDAELPADVAAQSTSGEDTSTRDSIELGNTKRAAASINQGTGMLPADFAEWVHQAHALIHGDNRGVTLASTDEPAPVSQSQALENLGAAPQFGSIGDLMNEGRQRFGDLPFRDIFGPPSEIDDLAAAWARVAAYVDKS